MLGKGLLIAGVGPCGVTALMLAWVSVGVIQLPAESAVLGARFALVRNLAAFVMTGILSMGPVSPVQEPEGKRGLSFSCCYFHRQPLPQTRSSSRDGGVFWLGLHPV